MGNSMMVGGVEVHVDGDGPCVVMIHGWPDTHRLWEPTVSALRARYRCVTFSLPGFDLRRPSQPRGLDDMIALFLEITNAVSPDHPVALMLHDWGALFGYQFAARYPARVARIIGVDVGDTFSSAFRKSLSAPALLMMLGYQSFLAATRFTGSLATPLTRWMAKMLRAPAAPEHIGAPQNYPYRMVFEGGFRHAVNFKPTCPTLFMYGSRKPFMFHSDTWLRVVEATPHGEVRALETGHWVMVDAPDTFNHVVTAWLERT